MNHLKINKLKVGIVGLGNQSNDNLIPSICLSKYAKIVAICDIDTKNSIYTKANFGIHLGDLDKSGFVFRGGLGYRLKVYKNILSNFELSYSYQNIYKSFENSQRPENYYNIESLGISIGIEIN